MNKPPDITQKNLSEREWLSLFMSEQLICNYLEFRKGNKESNIPDLYIVNRRSGTKYKIVLNSNGQACYELLKDGIRHLKLISQPEVINDFEFEKDSRERIDEFITSKEKNSPVLDTKAKTNIALQKIFLALQKPEKPKTTAIVHVRSSNIVSKSTYHDFKVDPKRYEEENAEDCFYEIQSLISDLKKEHEKDGTNRVMVKSNIPNNEPFIDTLVYMLDGTHYKYRMFPPNDVGDRKIFVWWDFNPKK